MLRYRQAMFSGVVYHANYLRFMERGRTNHLRLVGAEQHALFAEAQAETPGFAFVARSMQIDYLKPARMDDVPARAQVRVAFSSEGRAQPIPKALRTLLKADQA